MLMVSWESFTCGCGCETGECDAIESIYVTLRPLHDLSILFATSAVYFHFS